jgi:hypothetical protein
MPPPKIREVVEPEQLKEELRRCGVSAKRLDNVTEGLIFSIATRPERFNSEDKTGWSRIMMNEFPPDIPAVRIWFTFDDDKVYIERVDLLSEYL